MKEYYRVQVEIDLDAIYENMKRTRRKLKDGVRLMAVIKTDAYGHGAVAVAKAIDSLVDAYAVAIVEEAEELRREGVTKPILILSRVPQPLYPRLLDLEDVCPAIFTMEDAKCLSQEAGKKNRSIGIHLKVDTGMGRIGMQPDEQSADMVKAISELPGIIMEGCFTHFAKADMLDKEPARHQFELFTKFIEMLNKRGINPAICHTANSAAIMELPDTHLNMVRSGISTYGLYPSDEVDENELKLTPAMQMRAYVAHVKTVPEGTQIGYGGTFTAKRETRVATIPVGYGDGYPRSLSNLGRILIHGQYAPIIGRVCMDQFMVDVTGIEQVQVGDCVTLFGKDGENFISVEELANESGSFNYEFVCDVGKRVPRVFIRHGKKVGTMDFYENSRVGLSLELE